MKFWQRFSYYASLYVMYLASRLEARKENTVLLAAPLFLGDLCMALPAISRMQAARPDFKFILIVRSDLKDVCLRLRGFDRIIPFEKTGTFIASIHAERAKYGVCLFQERFVSIFKRLSVPNITFLSNLLKSEEPYKLQMPAPDLLLKLVSEFCETNRPLQHADQQLVSWLPLPRPQRKLPAKYAVIHCDGRSHFKKLPAWLIEEILRELEQKEVSAVLTGQWADVATQFSGRCVDLRGHTSLIEVLAISQSAQCVFGPDTGVTHFSASNKVPTWVALGPSGNIPYGESALIPSRIVWGLPDLDCRRDERLHGIELIRQMNCKGCQCRNKIRGYCLSITHKASASNSISAFVNRLEI